MPRSVFSIVSPNVTGPTAPQITVCEGSNSAGYQLGLGYYLDAGNVWKGTVQVLMGGGGAALLLNPSGGGVAVNKTTPAYALDVTGDVNTTGAFRINPAYRSQPPAAADRSSQPSRSRHGRSPRRL